MYPISPFDPSPEEPKATVVLVHGAFSDSSCWSGVIEELQRRGATIRAVANPLRGLAADSAHVANAIEQIPGRVLLVGHGYGGVVITNAAAQLQNAIGLVYVSGFIPDRGEVLQTIVEGSSDSLLDQVLISAHYPTPTGNGTAIELSIDPRRFREVFAADLPDNQSAILAITQRPAAAATFSEPSGAPAWKKLPSWAVIATCDKAAGTDVTRAHAARAEAISIELNASHLALVSQPVAVADLILSALGTVS
jgi:pimeloyl-ACP methyl ester carboxylesterase